jgi:tripartite-type tricarboxylate transporter receptor subunit TctC
MRIVALLLALAASTSTAAQGFPSKVVKITTPYSSGSGPDLYSRAFAENFARVLGQQVIVEPRPGGNGFIAVEAVKKAPPDGHELLVLANSHLTINPALFSNVPYDPVNDLTPIAGLYRTPFFITVAASGKYNSVRDLIEAATASPGRVVYGTPYVGSPAHLGSAIFEHETGTKMVHVPFKDTLQIYTAIANGDVDWSIATAASTAPMMKAGKVKLIALVGRQRDPLHPDIPTLGEVGGPKDLEVEARLVLLAPRGMQPALVEKINAEAEKALTSADMLKRTQNLGFSPYRVTPQEIAQSIRTELKVNAEVIKRVGIKSD